MKTFPTIKGRIGDWTYYVTTMKLAELANYVKFAEEIFPKNDLDQILQRELTERSKDIAAYLGSNTQRFLGSVIVAAVGGEPKFIPITLADGNSISSGEDTIGFLRFDGTEKYYALDGQHRLAAIIEALSLNPDRYAKDEISVLLVWHATDAEGLKRARRLFTTVNRYAKKTTRADDLVFDEDSPPDIYTRRLVRENAFFRDRIKVSNLTRAGEFSLFRGEALRAEHDYDGHFLMALLTFKRCNSCLLQDAFLKGRVQNQVLPEFEVLEEGYTLLASRWEQLLTHVPIWAELRTSPPLSVNKFRKKLGGHVLSRPIAIVAFIAAATKLFDSKGDVGRIDKVATALGDLTALPWRGLLWKTDGGGMHDGQSRRNAAADIFSYYLNGSPTLDEAIAAWKGATGTDLPAAWPDREALLNQ
jgi:DNA sulfur modification protein DndB